MDFWKNEKNIMKKILLDLKEEKMPVILYGAGLCGESYFNILKHNGIEVICFCDDDEKKKGKLFCGLHVISIDQLYNFEAKILISSYGPLKLYKRLVDFDSNLEKRIIWMDFYLWEDGLNYYDYYQMHNEEIQKAYSLLCDEKSKQVFIQLLQYKISRDRSLLEEIKSDEKEQYFDPKIIKFSDEEVFVDLGAYNGDSIKKFCETTNGNYKKIIAFEPDQNNYEELLRNTKNLHNVKYYSCGVFSNDTMLNFKQDSTWTSAVDEDGDTSIEVRSIDSLLLNQEITFIKADIEGLEKEMLLGARKTIKKYHPQMAIAIYHRKEDIFKIINKIYEYENDYSFYVRHYTEMPIDTVLYAVRKR